MPYLRSSFNHIRECLFLLFIQSKKLCRLFFIVTVQVVLQHVPLYDLQGFLTCPGQEPGIFQPELINSFLIGRIKKIIQVRRSAAGCTKANIIGFQDNTFFPATLQLTGGSDPGNATAYNSYVKYFFRNSVSSKPFDFLLPYAFSGSVSEHIFILASMMILKNDCDIPVLLTPAQLFIYETSWDFCVCGRARWF